MAFLTDVVKYATNILAVVAGTPRTAASVNGPLQGLANRTAWLRLFTEYLFGPWVEVTGADLGADTLYSPGHGLTANQAIQFRVVGGSLPAPLLGGTVYRAIVVDSDNFKVSLTSGPGPAVNLTGPMASDVYAFTIPDWIYDLLVVDLQWGEGPFANLVAWLAGTQTFTGAKTFNDITASAEYKYAPTNPGIMQAGAWIIPDPSTGNWVLGLNQAVAMTTIISNRIFHPLRMPHGSTLSAVSIKVIPQVLGRPGLPGSMPMFKVWKADFDGVTGPALATQVDPSASVAAYETPHTVDITVPFEIIDNTAYTYWLDVESESGVNSATQTIFKAPKTRCSITQVNRIAS